MKEQASDIIVFSKRHWKTSRTSFYYPHLRMSSNCNATSLHTNDAEEVDVPPPPPNKKYSITVDLEGEKGSDAKKWASRCGVLLRSIIPIGYEAWNDVFKDSLWKALMKEFDLNIDPMVARPILEKKFLQRYRTFKSTVRQRFLKKDGQLIPKHVALNSRPDDVDKVWWQRFVDIEYSDKKMKQCKTNSGNKAKSTLTHTLGRKPYLRLYEELAAENPGQKITRTVAWKVAHTSRKTGKVIPCAAEKFALVEAAEERQQENSSVNGSNGSSSFEDFENDPIVEVFGKEKRKNYCRAISSTSTMKQVKFTQASKAIANFKEDEDRKWKTKIENNQNRLTEEFKSMHSTMMSMQQSLLQFMNQFGGNATPRNEVASNSQHDSPRASLGVQSNGAIGSSTKDRQSVVLLSEELKDVAKGHLGTQKICHHREVMNGVRVVWVEKVFDPEAPIYEAPQNGNYKLFDIIDGGYIIWPECRVRCL